MKERTGLRELTREEVVSFFAVDMGVSKPFFRKALIGTRGVKQFGSPGFTLTHLKVG
jgi:hypothetical protein